MDTMSQTSVLLQWRSQKHLTKEMWSNANIYRPDRDPAVTTILGEQTHDVFHCFMLNTKINSTKCGGKLRGEVASFQLTTLQPGQQESNGPAPGAMTPLQPRERLDMNPSDQSYGWVRSDVVKEFQGIFLRSIFSDVCSVFAAKVSGVTTSPSPAGWRWRLGVWDCRNADLSIGLFGTREQLHALRTAKWCYFGVPMQLLDCLRWRWRTSPGLMTLRWKETYIWYWWHGPQSKFPLTRTHCFSATPSSARARKVAEECKDSTSILWGEKSARHAKLCGPIWNDVMSQFHFFCHQLFFTVPTRFCDEWLCRHQRKAIPKVLKIFPAFSGQLAICGAFTCRSFISF